MKEHFPFFSGRVGKCPEEWFWHTLGDARLLSVQRDRSTEDPKIVEGSCEKYESACCVGFAE